MPELHITDEQGNTHIFPDGTTPEAAAKAMGLKPPASAGPALDAQGFQGMHMTSPGGQDELVPHGDVMGKLRSGYKIGLPAQQSKLGDQVIPKVSTDTSKPWTAAAPLQNLALGAAAGAGVPESQTPVKDLASAPFKPSADPRLEAAAQVMAQGVGMPGAVPIARVLAGIGGASADQGSKAIDAFKEAIRTKSVGPAIAGLIHTAGTIPIVGPAAVNAGEEIGKGIENKSGDQILHGVGSGIGTVGALLTGTEKGQAAIDAATGAAGKIVPNAVKQMAIGRPIINGAPAPIQGPKVAPEVPKPTQAFASLLDKQGGKVNVVEAAQDVQPIIKDQLAKQGIQPKDISGQGGAQKVIDAIDAAKTERENVISQASQPFMQDQVSLKPIADSYRSLITDELRNNQPKLAQKIENEAAKFDRDGTIQEVNDFRVRMNKELDSYYNKGTSHQITSDVETRASEAAARAARQVQYQSIGDKAGIDPAHIRQIMREEGNLIETRNQLETNYNNVVKDNALAQSKGFGEKVIGPAGTVPTKAGIAAGAMNAAFGKSPIDLLNKRLQLAFSEPGNYQPLSLRPNPNPPSTPTSSPVPQQVIANAPKSAARAASASNPLPTNYKVTPTESINGTDFAMHDLNGKQIGTAGIRDYHGIPGKSASEVGDIKLTPDQQGKGLGQAFYTEAAKHAASLGDDFLVSSAKSTQAAMDSWMRLKAAHPQDIRFVNGRYMWKLDSLAAKVAQ